MQVVAQCVPDGRTNRSERTTAVRVELYSWRLGRLGYTARIGSLESQVSLQAMRHEGLIMSLVIHY